MGLLFRIFLICLLVSSKMKAQEYLLLGGNNDEFRFRYSQISYLAAGDSIQDLGTAVEKFRNGRFLRNTMPDLNLGIAKDNYWVHLGIVANDSDSSRFILSLNNPRLNEIRLFVLRKNELINEYVTGDNFPFLQRSIYNNVFDFPLKMKGNDTLDVLIHFLHKGNTLQVPISLFREPAWLQQTERNYLIIGVVTGIMILTLLFSFFLFLNSRRKLFLFYAFYITSITLWLWSTEGFGFQYLWPERPELATRLGPGFSVMNLFFFIVVGLEFCKPYESTGRIRKVLHMLKWIVLFWGIIPFLPIRSIIVPETMAVFLSVSFTIYFLFLMLMTIYLLWVSIRKNKIVFYYFFAVVISMAGSLIVVARHSGLLELPVSSGVFMSSSVVLEVILMTAGLAKQFYNMQKEKESVLRDYLDQQVAFTNTILKTQDAERRRISREMHDDIGAGLTQISLMSESAGQKTNNPEIIQISEKSRQLVNSLGEIVWSLNPENKSLDHFFAYLREELGKLLEYSSLGYEINFPDPEEKPVLTNEHRRNILLVVKEAVNNSIKYSSASRIEVKCELEEACLRFEVGDNGKGFDAGGEHRGNGLKNMKSRIQELEGVIRIWSEPGSGTRIQFDIPLKTTI